MVDEPNISGRAVPYAEIEIANGLGITPSEPNHFCEFPHSNTGTSDLEGRNAMLQQAGAGTNYTSKSEDGFSDDVDEYQNWVWQSFNNWIEYMYPNASRESN
ncbi:hypothetical protein NW767_015389 [Fusarium falciforme]|nr:hypothetical protein NW767_015389 [Fusarium falciforme]